MRLLKTALITGSARAIGQTTAELLNNEGAAVLMSDPRDEEGILTAKRLFGKADYIHLDAGDENSWITVAEYYGSLDILNNAGISGFLELSGTRDAESAT